MISVVASAFTIMLLYLITIRLIEMFRGPLDEVDMSDKIGSYGGALLGAFTLMFSHTHWFNAVEAEMYASSTMLTAFVVWAVLRWSDEYGNEYSERWIILISYAFGIGIGVHLLNLLAIFFIALIIYFRIYEFSIKTFPDCGGCVGSRHSLPSTLSPSSTCQTLPTRYLVPPMV